MTIRIYAQSPTRHVLYCTHARGRGAILDDMEKELPGRVRATLFSGTPLAIGRLMMSVASRR